MPTLYIGIVKPSGSNLDHWGELWTPQSCARGVHVLTVRSLCRVLRSPGDAASDSDRESAPHRSVSFDKSMWPRKYTLTQYQAQNRVTLRPHRSRSSCMLSHLHARFGAGGDGRRAANLSRSLVIRSWFIISSARSFRLYECMFNRTITGMCEVGIRPGEGPDHLDIIIVPSSPHK